MVHVDLENLQPKHHLHITHQSHALLPYGTAPRPKSLQEKTSLTRGLPRGLSTSSRAFTTLQDPPPGAATEAAREGATEAATEAAKAAAKAAVMAVGWAAATVAAATVTAAASAAG